MPQRDMPQQIIPRFERRNHAGHPAVWADPRAAWAIAIARPDAVEVDIS